MKIRKLKASLFISLWLTLIILAAATVNAQVITTVAGGFTGDGGPATAAALGNVQTVAIDGAGNMYIADIVDHRIRKVDPAGNITTFIGNGTTGLTADGIPASATLVSRPHGLIFDVFGNLIFADRGNHRIRKVDGFGIVTTIAGNGTVGFSGDGGPATSATLNEPGGLAYDSAGNLYFADIGNSVIRRVSTSGIIDTVAGTAGVFAFSGDGGPATAAALSIPRGVLVDGSGNIYIADTGNQRVRKVDTAGVITTIAGGGMLFGDGVPATSARLPGPRALAFDPAGNLLISVAQQGRVRRVNLSTGIITTVAGNFPGFNGDGMNALSTRFNQGMTGLLFDSSSNLIVADSSSGRVRKIDASQIVTTLVGGYLGDGNPAMLAAFHQPKSVDFDANGNMYIVDNFNFRVRKVDTAGVITTIAGNGFNGDGGDGGPATAASIEAGANGVAVDSAGNVLIADYNNCAIRKVNTSGIITTAIGTLGFCGYSGDGGPASAAVLNGPIDPTFDASGNLFFVDGDNCAVRKVNTAGIINTVAGNGTCGFSGDGGPATSATFNALTGIALDAAGNLYLADAGNDRVRKVNTSGIVNTIAGNGTEDFSGDGGPATSAALFTPSDVEVNAAGIIYISDTNNERIRMIDTAGIITTLAGTGECCFSGDGGPAINARMTIPFGLGLDARSNLYFTDDNIYRIRKITFDADISITKEASPSPVTRNSHLTYTITVTNDGPADATGVTISDSVPSGTSFVSASVSQGSCTTPAVGASSGTVTCNVGSMTNAASVTLTMVVNVTALQGATISNTASASASTPDPDNANDTATVAVAVVAGKPADPGPPPNPGPPCGTPPCRHPKP
jgi:uncharacterized repeat protein (TIGR01451 family)